MCRMRIVSIAGIALAVFLAGTGLPIPCVARLHHEEPELKEIQELRKEIRLENLVNALLLTAEDIEALLPILREARTVHEAFRAELEQQADEARAGLLELKGIVEQGVDVPKELAAKVNGQQERIRKTVEMSREDLAVMFEKVEEVLSENQRVLLAEFKACVVPHRSADGRIGQAEHGDRMAESLRRLYDAPESLFDRRLERELDKLEHGLLRKRVPAAQIEQHRTLFEEAVAQVRCLDEVDFEIDLQTIAADLRADFLALGEGRVKKARPNIRMIFDPLLITVLEDRLSAMK